MQRHYKCSACCTLRVARCLISILSIAGAPLTARAAERFWITPTGGNWGTPGVADADWSATNGGAGGATAPTTTDIANFTLNNTYEVTFSENVTNSFDIENGNVTFDLQGFTYAISSAAIHVGNVAGQTGRLTVLDGTVGGDTASDSIEVGSANDATGYLTIGTGGHVGSPGIRQHVLIGARGTGTLTVQNDGEMFATDLGIGRYSGSSGTATFTGPQALLDSAGWITVGYYGTGTMTVSAGADVINTSGSTIADRPGTTGVLTVTGASSTWTQTEEIRLGKSGVGTLNVQSRGALSTGTGTIGDFAGSFGTANVSGTGSLWMVSDSLIGPGFDDCLRIGREGEGTLNVTSGGQVLGTSSATLGSSAGSVGTVSVSGVGSRLGIASGMTIGSAGEGSLTISAGGQLDTTSATTIGSNLTGVGDVTMTGNGSAWTSGGNITVASSGTGTLTVENDAMLDVSGTLTLSDPAGAQVGTLNLRAGSITSSGFTRASGAIMNWTDGTLRMAGGSFNNGGAGMVINGSDADDLPTLQMASGATAINANLPSLTIGNTRAAAVEVTGGSTMSMTTASLGSNDGGNGTLSLSGLNSSFSVLTDFNVGGTASAAGGAGTVNIGTGAAVIVSDELRLWPGASVNVDGGTLQFTDLHAVGGKIQFNSGTISLLANLSADQAKLDAILGTAHSLGVGGTLALNGNTLTLSSNLTVDGGAVTGNSLSINAPTIMMVQNGGTVSFKYGVTNPTGARTFISDATVGAGTTLVNGGQFFLSGLTATVDGLSLNNTGLVAGNGRINNSLDNAVAGQVRVATGERLELTAAANSNNGLIDVNGGELEIASGTLTNSTVAPSTGLVTARNATLRFGGGLTNSGALTFTSGVSEVYGNITNTNLLSTTGRIIVSGGAQANFYDDITNNGLIQVSAAGSLASTAVFLGSLSGNGVAGGGHVFNEGDMRPGFSPGTMSFGGDLSFGPLAALEIELAGATLASSSIASPWPTHSRWPVCSTYRSSVVFYPLLAARSKSSLRAAASPARSKPPLCLHSPKRIGSSSTASIPCCCKSHYWATTTLAE